MEREHINVIGRISHFFAVNRPLSILLLVAVLFFGLFAFLLTPKQYNPEIVRPAFVVSLSYQGATVEEARDRVVYELVEKIRTVPGVDDVYTEVRDGASVNTTVIFEVGYDATKAKLDLLSQIDQHKYLRSGLVSDPHIMEINPETIPVLQVVFGAEDRTIPELREEVIEIAHELGEIQDVSDVSVHGGYADSLVVKVDPQKLAAVGVSADEVAATLSDSQSRLVHEGIESGSFMIETVLDTRVLAPEEVGTLIIRDGVRVRDVALVYEGVTSGRSYVEYHTAAVSGEVVVLAVSKVEGSSAPIVTESVIEEIDTLLSEDQYKALSYEVVSDDGATASREIYGLTKNLLTSIVIVGIVLMLFLSTHAAIVVLIAIPVTLLIVFGLGFVFDQTINRITLFALILSLGLLVDSAIVVVENIYSHLREWRANPSPHSRELVIARAVHEIGIGLLLSAVTSVIVFLPMGYITGMMGPYMGPIAFFVPAALIVSLFVAIIVTPFVAAHIITGENKHNPISAWFMKRMDRVIALYTRMLAGILRKRARQKAVLRGALFLFLISLVLPLSGLVHFQMLPKADKDQLYVYVDLPVEMNVAATRQFSDTTAELLLGDTDVVNIQSYVGEAPIIDFNGMFKGAQNRMFAHQATLRVNLTPASERARSSSEIVEDLRARTHRELSGGAAHVRFMEDPPGPPVRATFVAKVAVADPLNRSAYVRDLESVFERIDGVVDVRSSEEEPVGRVVYQFDHEAAAQLGVPLNAAMTAFMLLGDSYEVGEYLGGVNREFTPILLTVDPDLRQSPESINGIMVPSGDGEFVPLGAVVTPHTALRPSRMEFDQTKEITYITAEVEGRSIVYVMIDTIRALVSGDAKGLSVEHWGLFGMELKDLTTGERISIDWGGEWEMTLENFRDLGIAMGVALILVYGVLVAQYNRFATPAYILVTVPLGLVGILWGFFILDSFFDVYLTATALIGFIALIGLVVNNAIIFLEYVEQQAKRGRSYEQALVAAGEARIRPILLTSLTTVLGSLTIASDPVWSGLAWAIVFGLSLSTILTLVIYPTLLMYFTGGQNQGR